MSVIIAKRVFFFVFVFVFFVPASLSARDFGLILNQGGGTGGSGGRMDSDYTAILIPRLSFLIGDVGDLHLSASIEAACYNDDWDIVPELLRAEFSWRSGNTDLRLGRMVFSDPLSIAAAGLFDGVRLSHHTMSGTFGVGVWFTGLLYRNRANIAMTEHDDTSAWGFGDPAGHYFASRRLMWALYWNHPFVAEMLRLNITMMGQFDLNGRYRASHYHNQYLMARASLPLQRFIFDLGGVFELAQATGNGSNGNTEILTAFAADAGIHWAPPAQFPNMLSLTCRFSSGEGDSLSAFTPITAASYGEILQAGISGLCIISLTYTARLHHTFSASMNVSHFISMGNSASSLGTELFGRLIWSPVSDLSLNLGGGAFLSAHGNSENDLDTRWRIELAATLALR